jgi:hypothetical protein
MAATVEGFDDAKEQGIAQYRIKWQYHSIVLLLERRCGFPPRVLQEQSLAADSQNP